MISKDKLLGRAVSRVESENYFALQKGRGENIYEVVLVKRFISLNLSLFLPLISYSTQPMYLSPNYYFPFIHLYPISHRDRRSLGDPLSNVTEPQGSRHCPDSSSLARVFEFFFFLFSFCVNTHTKKNSEFIKYI